jgi:transcriptional regulator with XRE-family HTH domain
MMSNPGLRAVFAQNVKLVRRLRGLSQDQLGAMAGLHRSYVSSLESGKKNPTLDTIDRLACALATSPIDLLTCHEIGDVGTLLAKFSFGESSP